MSDCPHGTHYETRDAALAATRFDQHTAQALVNIRETR